MTKFSDSNTNPAADWKVVEMVKLGREVPEEINALTKRLYAHLDAYLYAGMGVIDRELRGDVLQQFFLEHFATKKLLLKADPARGELKSFAVVCLTRFAWRYLRKAHLQRGRVRELIADQQAAVEIDRFEDAWARSVIRAAGTKVAEWCVAAGHARTLEVWHARNGANGDIESMQALADRFDVRRSTIKRDVDRARDYYIKAIREELAQELGTKPDLIDEAIVDLRRILGS